jgi:hypothetical protein
MDERRHRDHLEAMSRVAAGGCKRTRDWAEAHVAETGLLVAELERLSRSVHALRVRSDQERAAAFLHHAAERRLERGQRRVALTPARLARTA